jgi:predicted nucleotidyltransferase
MTKRAIQSAINAMVRQIVNRFHPEQVILFGSFARGNAGPDSDVDLLVVMPVEGSKRAKQVEIRVALRGIPVPKDIIVSTPEEFAWRRNVVGTIEEPASREGKVLYARP